MGCLHSMHSPIPPLRHTLPSYRSNVCGTYYCPTPYKSPTPGLTESISLPPASTSKETFTNEREPMKNTAATPVLPFTPMLSCDAQRTPLQDTGLAVGRMGEGCPIEAGAWRPLPAYTHSSSTSHNDCDPNHIQSRLKFPLLLPLPQSNSSLHRASPSPTLSQPFAFKASTSNSLLTLPLFLDGQHPEASQRYLHPHLDVEVAVGSGHSGEPVGAVIFHLPLLAWCGAQQYVNTVVLVGGSDCSF